MRMAAAVLCSVAVLMAVWLLRAPAAWVAFGTRDVGLCWDGALRACRQVEATRLAGDGTEERWTITVLGPVERVREPWLRLTVDASGVLLHPLHGPTVRAQADTRTIVCTPQGWRFSPVALPLVARTARGPSPEAPGPDSADWNGTGLPDFSADLAQNLYRELAARVPAIAELLAGAEPTAPAVERP